MAEKPNEEANSSQSSQLHEENLQKFVGDGRNNACSSNMAGGSVYQLDLLLILTLVSDYLFTSSKILLFSFEN